MNEIEKEILAATKEAAQYNVEGKDPNDSIIKVALDRKLNAHKIARVVEAFNIAKHHQFFRSDATDKTAAFPIAEIDPILKAVFKDSPVVDNQTSEKTASLDLIVSREKNVKVASEPENIPVSTVKDLPQNIEFLASHALGAVKLAKDEEEFFRSQKQYWHDAILSNGVKIASYFNQLQNRDEFVKFASILRSAFGQKGDQITEIVRKAANTNLPELPSDDNVGILPMPKSEPYNHVIELFDALGRYKEAHENHEKSAADFLQKEAKVNELLGIKKEAGMGVLGEDPVDLVIKNTNHPLNFNLAARKGTDSAITDMAAKAQESAAKAKHAPSKAIDDDPEIQDFKRMTMLNEMLESDPIISKLSPEDVQSAYNSITQMAPTVSLSHPEIVRSVLRQASAQQALDPFTAKQLVELEQSITQNRLMAAGKLPQKR